MYSLRTNNHPQLNMPCWVGMMLTRCCGILEGMESDVRKSKDNEKGLILHVSTSPKYI